MADESTTIEKHYCYPTEQNNSALWAALMSKDNHPSPLESAALMRGCNQWDNHPMMYLIWMWVMRFMGNGYNDNYGPENFNSRQIAALQETVNTNHNNDIAIDAIRGNANSIHELANTLNVDFNTMSQAVCGVKSAIESVGANVGFSAERVINAINSGDANIISAIQSTACSTQKAVIEQGYQNQLMNERQTGVLGSKIDQFQAATQLQTCQQTNTLQASLTDNRQAIVSGFSQLGYELANQSNRILQGQRDQTQHILDSLNNRWQLETSQALQDAKFEVSQMKQNQYLAGIIAGNNNCNC